jgi:hypothetical protein
MSDGLRGTGQPLAARNIERGRILAGRVLA